MDISPIELLLVVFAYEKRTEETVTIVEIRDGSFGPKLIQQDFDTAPSGKPIQWELSLILHATDRCN